jgi:hypothetical protein
MDSTKENDVLDAVQDIKRNEISSGQPEKIEPESTCRTVEPEPMLEIDVTEEQVQSFIFFF